MVINDSEQQKQLASYFRFETRITLEELSEYIESAESSFEAFRDMSEDPEMGFSIVTDEDVFARSLHFSFVVLLHLIVEDRLKRTCEYVQKIKALPLQFKDLRGDTLEQCMTFLVKLAGVQREKLSRWQDITDLYKVRNCIVHASGNVGDSRDKDRLEKLASQKPSFFSIYKHLIYEEEELRISLGYCIDVTKAAIEFFQSLFDALGILQLTTS